MKTFLTQSNQIRGLTKQQYTTLRVLCRISKNLYNVGLYNIRQYYFKERKYLSYESNYKYCKDNENYKLLQAGVSQQILMTVDKGFKSFFGLLHKQKHGTQVHIPHYLPREGFFPLILSTNAYRVKSGYLTLPVSRTYRKLHPDVEDIRIPFPRRLQGKTLKEVRIVPLFGARYFKIQYVYAQKSEAKRFDKNRAVGIDLGLNNLATCVTTDRASFIVDGKKLKSINRLYNKTLARLKSIASKQGIIDKLTNRMARITLKRNN